VIELTEIVLKYLTLTDDGKCAAEGHELIPRACIHCGLTIHQISDANDGILPMRDTPTERAEHKDFLVRQLKHAEKAVDSAIESRIIIQKKLEKMEKLA
jgi:hypothetical protein